MKRIKFIFAWYDLWIGIFYDYKKQILYVFPIPMLGFKISLGIYCPKCNNYKLEYEMYNFPSIDNRYCKNCK